MTRIAKTYECDVFLDPLPESFIALHVSQTMSDQNVAYDVVIYGNSTLINRSPELIPTALFAKLPVHQEMQYLNMI